MPTLSVPRTRPRRIAATVASALAAVVLAGCAAGGSAGSGEAESTTLVIASASLPTVFARDAAGGTGYANLEYAVNTQIGLIQQAVVPDPADPELQQQDQYELAPALASSWEASADGLTYTFHLREDVTSVAGNPFTADDVMWSWERKFNSGSTPNTQNPIITDYKNQLKKIDDHTVSFSVTKPGYGFTLLSLLANSSAHVYDSTLLKAHTSTDDPYAVKWTNENPNYGFGAYQRTSYTSGTEMVLEANPNYPLAKPHYTRLVYRVTADPASRANTVRTGDADIAAQIRPADQRDLAASGEVKIPTFPTTNMMTMLPMITAVAPFDDPAVRRAFSYAVPYQQIIDNVYFGRANAMVNGMLDPSLPNWNGTGLAEQTFDPARAKELLAAAGHPDGLSFTLTVQSDVPDLVQTAIQIQSFAKEAGFTVEIEQVPAATFATELVSRKKQALLWRDQAISSSPQYQLGLFYKKGKDGGPAGSNITGWTSDEYQSIIDQGASLPDPTSVEANSYWNQAQQFIAESQPMVFIARVQPLNAFRSGITGFTNRLDNLIEFAQLRPAASTN
jgi:peptide/nickel transport system substrate-binding protein